MLWNGLVDLLYPPVCLVCGEEQPEALCPVCVRDIQPVAPPFCDRCGEPIAAGDLVGFDNPVWPLSILYFGPIRYSVLAPLGSIIPNG